MTGGGIRAFNAETGRVSVSDEADGGLGLVTEDVHLFYEDRKGGLWLGTSDALLHHDGTTFKPYSHDPTNPKSIGDGGVQAVLEDDEGRLWIGTSEGGLCLMDRALETFRCYRHDPADPTTVSANAVQALAQGPDGALWIGTYGGDLNRIDDVTGTFHRFAYDPGLAGGGNKSGIRTNRVDAIRSDRSGVLWVATWGDGVRRLSQGSSLFTAYHPPATLPGVAGVVEDGFGMLWMATFSGLFRHDR